MWVYFLAGRNRKGEVAAVGIGMSRDPETEVIRIEGLMPFKLELAGMEEGGQKLLEALKKRFKRYHLHGPWYTPADELKAYLDALPPASVGAQTKRVSLDLTLHDYVDLDEAVKQRGLTKSKFLRQAVHFYLAIHRYNAQGYLIQAIKDGDLVQFHDLKDPRSSR